MTYMEKLGNIVRLAAAAVLIAAALSCTRDEQVTGSLELASDRILISDAGTPVLVSLDANIEWRIEYDTDNGWMSTDLMGGKASTKGFMVEGTENTGESLRYQTIRVFTVDHAAEKEVTVIQLSSYPAIIFESTSMMTLMAAEARYSIAFTANVPNDGIKATPSADWLNIVVTNKARTKIRQKLSEAEFQKAAEGKELLERRLKNWKLELNDEDLAALMKKTQYKNVNAFFAAVGEGTVDIADIKNFLDRKETRTADEAERQPEKAPVQATASRKQAGATDDIMVIDARDVKSLDYKMAKCCNPVYGDDVFGFVSIKDGIKIHRMSCANAARLMERFPYRIQKVVWQDSASSGDFQCTLAVTAALEHPVLTSIMDIIGQFKVSMRSCNVKENPRMGTYEIQIRLLVPSNTELDKVISQISNIKSVMRVKRV